MRTGRRWLMHVALDGEQSFTRLAALNLEALVVILLLILVAAA